MATVRVVVGVAGGGKTGMAIDIVEQALRDGVKWHEIGFFSFSRAACAEAAERASKLCGVEPEKLQHDGFFRTLHSAALRMLGVDAKVLIDPSKKKDQDWFDEYLGCQRGGERGTLAALIGDELDEWDVARSRLIGLDEPVIRGQVQKSAFGPQSGLNSMFSKTSPERCLSDIQQKTQGSDPDCGPSTNFQTADSESCLSVFCPKTQGNSMHCGPNTMFLDTKESNSVFKSSSEITAELVDLDHNRVKNQCFICKKASDSSQESAVGNWLSGPQSSSDPMYLALNGSDSGSEPEMQNIGVRCNCGPVLKWAKSVVKYEEVKRQTGRMDFTDLLLRYAGIEFDQDLRPKRGYTNGSVPAELKLVIVDEFQDCSPLLWLVAQRLASFAEDVWLLGDRYQAVYGFSGSDWRVMAAQEAIAKAEGLRTVLNRSWRNPPQILEWGEAVLREDRDYDERRPISEVPDGSVGMVEMQEFLGGLGRLSGCDVMILGRAWFAIERIQKQLDLLGIPWKSVSEKQKSRWEAPVKIAYVLVCKELAEGKQISESDWRRVTNELPQKVDGVELFVRGTKAKWSKVECSVREELGLDGLQAWGATAAFAGFIRNRQWESDSYGLISRAIDQYGIDEVRDPSVKLGTVHSVKGMEAENVFVIATSSEKASGEQADFYEELFLKYVAITRASRNYRVVVDQVDQARGRTLFLPCPKGYWKFEGMPNVERKQRTSQSDEVAEGPWDLRGEVSGRDLRGERNAGHPDMPGREIHSDRDEEVRWKADEASGTGSDEGPEEWWDL